MAQTEAMSEIKQQALVDINEAQNEKEHKMSKSNI